jgi:DNA-directed RNA polymerase specialized sigma24 family protein
MTAPDDPATWAEFVDWYGRKICAWCRTWGPQEADAQDVTQEVFLNLSVRLQDFRYDPRGSFRAWLKTLPASPGRITWPDSRNLGEALGANPPSSG